MRGPPAAAQDELGGQSLLEEVNPVLHASAGGLVELTVETAAAAQDHDERLRLEVFANQEWSGQPTREPCKPEAARRTADNLQRALDAITGPGPPGHA